MNDGGSTEGALPLDDVSRLVELMTESGVGEIRIRKGELEITVKAKAEAPVAPPAPLERLPQAEAEIATELDASAEHLPERNGNLHVVRSPLVGTFYRSPSPGEEPYVEVGDHVGEGQTLCMVEAMKLFNEIPADISGEVIEILAENAKGVEYDQPLFRIRSEAP